MLFSSRAHYLLSVGADTGNVSIILADIKCYILVAQLTEYIFFIYKKCL
jgi:hypothetical protein